MEKVPNTEDIGLNQNKTDDMKQFDFKDENEKNQSKQAIEEKRSQNQGQQPNQLKNQNKRQQLEYQSKIEQKVHIQDNFIQEKYLNMNNIECNNELKQEQQQNADSSQVDQQQIESQEDQQPIQDQQKNEKQNKQIQNQIQQLQNNLFNSSVKNKINNNFYQQQEKKINQGQQISNLVSKNPNERNVPSKSPIISINMNKAHKNIKNQEANSLQFKPPVPRNLVAPYVNQTQMQEQDERNSDWDFSSERSAQQNKNPTKRKMLKDGTYASSFEQQPNNKPKNYQNIDSQDDSQQEDDDENQNSQQVEQHEKMSSFINNRGGIYNTSQIYNEVERQQYGNLTQNTQSGYYNSNQVNQSQGDKGEFIMIQARNTDGKQYDQQFRRRFAKMLLDKTKGLQRNIAMQIISKESEKIKVYSNQVMIWMSIYKIVFAVQVQKAKRRMAESEVTKQIESRAIDYLNQNPNQRKYKFIKICNRAFRALNIKKTTGDYWLRQLFKRYESRLNPQINTARLLQKLQKRMMRQGHHRSGRYQPFDDDFFQTRGQKTGYLELKCQNAFQNEVIGGFPNQTKERTVRKMDKAIQNAISRIFQQKINQFCIDVSQMKRWYMRFGRLKLFNPNTNFYQDQVTTSAYHQKPIPQVPIQSQRPLLNPNIQNILSNGPKRAENQVLNFIKMNPNSDRTKVYSIALNIVQRLQVQQLMNQAIFMNWFNNILNTHCVLSNNFIKLKQIPPIPIRINDPQRPQNQSFQIPINNNFRPNSLQYSNGSKKNLF